MPSLPIPIQTTLGSEIPVSSAEDVLFEFPAPQKNPETATNRDAIAASFAEGFIRYQNAAERAAAQSDPLRATGNYLKGYAEEHQVVPGRGESETSLRARIFASPSIVTPDAIEAAINEIISPAICYVSELDLDGWFIHGAGDSVWESFVGADPDYPDRYYDDIPTSRPGGCIPTNNLPRSFFVRIPALQAQDEAIQYIGDSFFIFDSPETGSNYLNIYQNQQTSVDLFNAIIARVESIKGQGITWSMLIDPRL